MVHKENPIFSWQRKSSVRKSLEGQYSPECIAELETIGHYVEDQGGRFMQDQEFGPLWLVERDFRHRDRVYATKTVVYPQIGSTANDNTIEFMRNLGPLRDNTLSMEFVHELNANRGLKYVPRDEGVRGERSLYQLSSQPSEFMNSTRKYLNELGTHDAGEATVKPLMEKLWESCPRNGLIENRVVARQLVNY